MTEGTQEPRKESQKAPEDAQQAVFCVSAEPDVIATAAEIADKLPSTVFVGEFRDYITAGKRPQFPPILRGTSPCIAIVDFDKDPELALQTTARLQQIFLKRINIIGIGSKLDGQLLVRGMRAGCTEYLTKPVKYDELVTAFERFGTQMLATPSTQSSLGRVIAFFGAKGGVGTTTLAVHLATFLVRQYKKKILLIDHKHQLGHVALYLGLKDTQYHFDELMRNVDRLDSALLSGFLIRHESGLDVIPSPEVATAPFDAKEDQLARVMDFLRREYDYVLIDSWAGYQDSRLSLIDQADEIYLVSTPDVASLRDLAMLVESMSLATYAKDKLRLVLNRSTAQDSLNALQIQRAMPFPIAVTIANNYVSLMRAINEGEPISPAENSIFNEQMLRWCQQIVEGKAITEVPNTKKKKGFNFWR